MAATREPHPPIEMLKAFGLGHGNLDDAMAEAVSKHIDTCSDCLNTIASLSGDSFLGRVQNAHARPAMPPVIPPELLNHPEYDDIVELDGGGMGVVYVARQPLMKRQVALKIIKQSLLDEPGATERFEREIQAAAILDHANIVKAHTAFRAGRLLVLVMEYVRGEDLGRLVKRVGPLPVPNACGYAHQVARGLKHAFEKGLVHRDIKPQNLMLSARGIKPHIKHVVKILDFGLAKARKAGATGFSATRTGSVLGTPHYIAPEQIEDAARADIRADLYSLGCTLYFLLTGAPPFDGLSEIKLLDAHRHDKPRSVAAVRPEVPGELAAIIDKLLLKKPADRYQTPSEVAEVLSPFFKDGIKAIRLSDAQPTPKQAQPGRDEALRTAVAGGTRMGILVRDQASPTPPPALEKRGGSATMARGPSRPLPGSLPPSSKGKAGDRPAQVRGRSWRSLKVFVRTVLAIGILVGAGGYIELERRKAEDHAEQAKEEARKARAEKAEAVEKARNDRAEAMKNAGGPQSPVFLPNPPDLVPDLSLLPPAVLGMRAQWHEGQWFSHTLKLTNASGEALREVNLTITFYRTDGTTLQRTLYVANWASGGVWNIDDLPLHAYQKVVFQGSALLTGNLMNGTLAQFSDSSWTWDPNIR
jgi:serine/threonine protein kinase